MTAQDLKAQDLKAQDLKAQDREGMPADLIGAVAVSRELQHARRVRYLHAGLAVCTPAVLLVLWEIFGDVGQIDRRLFPPPSRILAQASHLIASGVLRHDLLATLGRLLLGLLLGAVAGAVAGLLMGGCRALNAALGPTFAALYAVPKIAILPLLLLIFGLTETPKIVAVAISVFFVVQINVVAGVRQIDSGLLEAGCAYGAVGWRRFVHVIFPAAMPYLFSGLRISAGMAVIVVTAVEFVASNSGLGYLIWNSWQLFQPEQMYVGLMTVSLLGAAVTGLVVVAEWLAVPWRREARSSRSIAGRRS